MEYLREKSAIEHYRQRLAALAFGLWVSWLSETKTMEENAALCAVDYCTSVTLEEYMNRLQWAVRRSNTRFYYVILADTMKQLILKRKGVRGLTVFRERIKPAANNSLWSTMADRTSCVNRLFVKWKGLHLVKARTISAIRGAIVDGTGSALHMEWVGGSMAQWKTHMLSMQLRNRQLSMVINFRREVLKLCFIRKLKAQVALRVVREEAMARCNLLAMMHSLKRVLHALRSHCIQNVGDRLTLSAADRLARRGMAVRVLRQLWRRVSRSRDVAAARARSDGNSRVASQVRVLRVLLRCVRDRIVWKLPLRTKVGMFLVHSWATRRRSSCLALWECYLGRRKVESRRRKIADFQLRDRLLRLAFAGVRKSIASLSHQRHAEFEGQFSQMKKGLQCGWRSLSLYRAKKGREHGHAYRAGLLWKFRRELHAFNRLREHVHTRRAKRSMVQEARAAFALSEQRAACAEFIRIAYADSAETDRQQRLASWAAKRWKRFTARRRAARQQYSSTMSPYSRQCVQSGRDAAQLGRESGLASTVLAPTLTRTPASMVFHRPHSSDLHVLSRAKPRTLTAGLVSVPPLHADCALDYRCAPASTRSTEAAAASRPYAYLALSTPLSRPLPTSRGLQPPPMCSPPAAPGLTSARSSGGEAHVGSSAHEQKSAHCSTKTNEPTPPLSCALPAVSEELVSAAEALLEGGTTSQATLQALTEFFAMKKAAMCRQAQHRHFAD